MIVDLKQNPLKNFIKLINQNILLNLKRQRKHQTKTIE